MQQHEVVDLRTPGLDLTDRERTLLGAVVARDYADVPELGRSLGCNDDTVRDTIGRVIAKLDRFAAPALDLRIDQLTS